MRAGLMMMTLLAAVGAFSAAVADTGDSRAVQAPDAAATIAAPGAPVVAGEAAMPEEAASAESRAEAPAAADAPAPPAAEADASAASDDASATPTEGANAPQPITVKMASAAPPADFKIPAGYRPVKRGLDTVYCTTITPTGSRMPKTYCMSREQVQEQQRQAEVARRDVAQKTGSCDGGGCGAN